jgi:hypothetical protein
MTRASRILKQDVESGGLSDHAPTRMFVVVNVSVKDRQRPVFDSDGDALGSRLPRRDSRQVCALTLPW